MDRCWCWHRKRDIVTLKCVTSTLCSAALRDSDWQLFILSWIWRSAIRMLLHGRLAQPVFIGLVISRRLTTAVVSVAKSVIVPLLKSNFLLANVSGCFGLFVRVTVLSVRHHRVKIYTSFRGHWFWRIDVMDVLVRRHGSKYGGLRAKWALVRFWVERRRWWYIAREWCGWGLRSDSRFCKGWAVWDIVVTNSIGRNSNSHWLSLSSTIVVVNTSSWVTEYILRILLSRVETNTRWRLRVENEDNNEPDSDRSKIG